MDSLSLGKILEAFNAPINEEQAWAVCYQCAKWLRNDWEHSGGSDGCFRLESHNSIFVHKDGSVTCGAQNSEKAYTQFELVQSLGVLVFQALDYGLGDGEEHKLSPPLESLIELMTVSNDNADEDKDVSVDGDEGIENDSEEDDDKLVHNQISLNNVIQRCESHLIVSTEAESHYRAVCRALVAEAQELLTFLEKVTEEQKILKESPDEVDSCEIDLCRADWARLWIQLMKELRHGVKLKKVEQYNEPPIEYALTPYEILMQDIKTKRYTLNKVMVNGSFPPRVKADAHSMILEFIRSRPPLHPVKDRVLNSPPPKDDSPHEQLLQAIRSEPRLRPVSPSTYVETSRTKLSEGDATPNTMRRLIKPDISLTKFSISDDEDSDLEDEDSDDERNKVSPSPLSPLTPLSPHSPWQQSDGELSDELDDEELAEIQAELEEEEAETLPRFVPYRRHSVSTCIKPVPKKPIGNPLECLSLTVEEVMHIRGVLTKAELECQMMDAELRELLAKGKVCFTCKTTRFSLFGPWSTKCRFCKRNVCSKCFSKMQIPAEHFEHIPVYTLSPSPLSPKTSKDIFNVFENTGSAPSSPVLERKDSPILVNTDNNGNSNRRSRPPMLRSMTVAKPPAPPPPTLQGPMMAVCKDCKVMICHVIRASRLSVGKTGYTDMSEYSPQKPSRKFHLDLKPVYK